MEPAQDMDRTAFTASSKPELLRLVAELALRSHVLCASLGGDTDEVDPVSGELAAILERSIEVLGALEQLPRLGLADEYDFSEPERDTYIGARISPEAAPRLEDICFAAALELDRARRDLVPLAALTAGAHHGAVRVADRLLLREQRDRLLEWSRAGRPVSSGLQLLEDIWVLADLLRDINRRQELRAHDAALIRELLHPAAQASAAWQTKLERLSGLDDDLDALIVRAQVDRGPESMMDVLLRLSCLI